MSTHEDFKRHAEAKGSSDRAFGIVFAIFFSLVALAPLRTHHPIRWWALGAGAVVLAATLIRPGWLHPFNYVWTKLGLLLGRIVSPVVMGLMFFLVVTPTAFLFRLFGKDPLRLAKDAGARTYWIERRPPGPAPESMANQF
jgi:hypothetical protein